MDDFYFRNSHIPAFGSWDCDYDLPFTQCFDSATHQAGVFRYSYSEDRDLYVAGDLYKNDVFTPAVIVVPRRRKGKGSYSSKKDGKKEAWVVCDGGYDFEEPQSPISVATPPRRVAAKAVDEDLYKISPDLLRAHPQRKKSWGLFSSCLSPTCVC